MKIIKNQITLIDLNRMSEKMYGNLIKAVVDIDQGIMVVDAELHADEEQLLLENGSKQQDLWGINLYPNLSEDDFIEFDSMINLRPSQNNRSRGVDDPKIQVKIRKIVNKLVKK